MAVLCECAGGKAYFFIFENTVSVLTIRTFGDELYKMGTQAHLPRKPKSMTLAPKVIDFGVQFT